MSAARILDPNIELMWLLMNDHKNVKMGEDGLHFSGREQEANARVHQSTYHNR
jgi:hypothetical protein